MKIYFVRHGQSIFNIKGLCNDDPKKDTGLTHLGTKQSEQLAKRLKEKRLDVIFVSEFPRAKQTADILNEYHNVPLIVDPRLNERKTGFDGKPCKEFDKFISRNRFHIKPRKAESWQEEKIRIFSFLDDLKKKRYESAFVVTHGDNMQIIRGYFEELSDEEMWNEPYSENCEVMEFEI